MNLITRRMEMTAYTIEIMKEARKQKKNIDYEKLILTLGEKGVARRTAREYILIAASNLNIKIEIVGKNKIILTNE